MRSEPGRERLCPICRRPYRDRKCRCNRHDQMDRMFDLMEVLESNTHWFDLCRKYSQALEDLMEALDKTGEWKELAEAIQEARKLVKQEEE